MIVIYYNPKCSKSRETLEILETKKADYKVIKYLDFTDEELIKVMAKYPKLIERPIVINGDKATIGRPPIKILDII